MVKVNKLNRYTFLFSAAILFAGCAQFDSPVEILAVGRLEVVTTSDAKCVLSRSGKSLMEWIGSKTLHDLVPGDYIIKITSEKYLTSFEESFILKESGMKLIETSTGGLELKLRSDILWELKTGNKILVAGRGSAKIDSLWIGKYMVQLSVPDINYNISREISISKSQTFVVKLEYGSLDVKISPQMEAILFSGSVDIKRWYGSTVIDSLIAGEYTLQISINPDLPNYTEKIEIFSHETKLVEPQLASFNVVTKSTFHNILSMDNIVIFAWTGSKDFQPYLAGAYSLKSRMFTNAFPVEQNFDVSIDQKKEIVWDYGQVSVTATEADCNLLRDDRFQFSWRGDKIFDSLITGTYTVEIQNADFPLWSKQFVLNKDQRTEISIPYATLNISVNAPNAITKLIFAGREIQSLTGNGSLTSLVPGTYTLICEAPKYKTKSENISLRDGQIQDKQIFLEQFMEIIQIPGGGFNMGCTAEQGGCDGDETPVHQVSLSAYAIGKYEVTQAQWLAVMGTNPSYFVGLDRPVDQVTWFEAVAFCNELSLQEGYTPVYTVNGTSVTADWNSNGYRLPTEAEWEYAARGGASSANTKYSGSNSLDDVAWYSLNSASFSHAVGTKNSNQLGIYDMSGNVWEWCWDWYGNYSSAIQGDPRGPDSGANKVLRGGSWFTGAYYCRVSFRDHYNPGYRDANNGFRVVRKF